MLLFLVFGCVWAPVDQIELMPAPDVYGDGLLDPLPDQNPFEQIPYGGMLYATDRKPAGPDDAEKYYVNDRGTILRIGVARIDLGEKHFTWDKAREISLLKSRTAKFPIKVRDVEEWGILNNSIPYFTGDKAIRSATIFHRMHRTALPIKSTNNLSAPHESTSISMYMDTR